MHFAGEPDWVNSHRHDPNPVAPLGDGAFVFRGVAGAIQIDLSDLRRMPLTMVQNCMIVSTGHSVSGPFLFGGVRLLDLVHELAPELTTWSAIDVISADGFGARLSAADLATMPPDRPALVAYLLDGAAMARSQGLVRLVVPTEVGDALRQVKWIAEIRILP